MKKLKIQFWKPGRSLVMQILEQEGLPKEKTEGDIRIFRTPELRDVNVFLRGDYSPGNSDIVWIGFDTQYELNIYLNWAVKAITDELFTEGELKVGEMCEVWDEEFKKWQERKLLAILPENYEERFIVANLYYPNRYVPFSDARPIGKHTKLTVEDCGQLITYTWEEK